MSSEPDVDGAGDVAQCQRDESDSTLKLREMPPPSPLKAAPPCVLPSRLQARFAPAKYPPPLPLLSVLREGRANSVPPLALPSWLREGSRKGEWGLLKAPPPRTLDSGLRDSKAARAAPRGPKSLPPRVLASREQAGEASDPGPVGGPPEVAHHQRDESDASLLTRDRSLPSPL